MDASLIAAASWLHLLATVTMIGWYLLLFLVFSLVFAQRTPNVEMGHLVVDVHARSRLFVLVSLLIFIVTGVLLMSADPQYTGLGQIDNAWSVVILVKHVVIVGMIGLGAYLQRGPVRALETALRSGSPARVGELMAKARTPEMWMALLGVIVLPLTAVAEVM